MNVMMIRPRFDDATNFSFLWAENLLDQIKPFVTVKYDFKESEAARLNYEQNVKDVDLVAFYDHGDEHGLVQNGGSGYVIDNENNEFLKNKIIYTMACLWSSNGGVDTWKKGAEAVFGYFEVFGFTTVEEHLFMEAANSGLVYRVETGAGWKEVFEFMKGKFNEMIDQAEDSWSKVWLRYDRDALRYYGADSPPVQSSCMFRRLALKLFGLKGWHLKKLFFG